MSNNWLFFFPPAHTLLVGRLLWEAVLGRNPRFCSHTTDEQLLHWQPGSSSMQVELNSLKHSELSLSCLLESQSTAEVHPAPPNLWHTWGGSDECYLMGCDYVCVEKNRLKLWETDWNCWKLKLWMKKWLEMWLLEKYLSYLLAKWRVGTTAFQLDWFLLQLRNHGYFTLCM